MKKLSAAVVILMLTHTMINVAALKTVWKNFDTMTWESGDRRFKHWMLAVDNKRVVHSLTFSIKKKKNLLLKMQSNIEIQKREDAPKVMFKHDKCINHGPGVYGPQAVERAMSWIWKRPYWYNPFTCNCYHWVNLWCDGRTRSIDNTCPRHTRLK